MSFSYATALSYMRNSCTTTEPLIASEGEEGKLFSQSRLRRDLEAARAPRISDAASAVTLAVALGRRRGSPKPP
eukprot:4560694-Pyramimonas_sp.AAC.1